MKLHKLTLIAIILALLVVPYQFEIYQGSGHRFYEYYGYALLFDPPTHHYFKNATNSILWSRVFVEIAIILIVNYMWMRKSEKDEQIKKAIQETLDYMDQIEGKPIKIYTVSPKSNVENKKEDVQVFVTRQFDDISQKNSFSPIIYILKKAFKSFFKIFLIAWALWVVVFFAYVFIVSIKDLLFN